MSTHWSPKCVQCNEQAELHYEANRWDVREMIKHRDALAALYPPLLALQGYFTEHPLTGSTYDPHIHVAEFFAKHAGHEVRPVNTYGTYDGD